MSAAVFLFLIITIPLTILGLLIWHICKPHDHYHVPTQYNDKKTGETFNNTRYAQTHDFKDFDPVLDNDKMGSSAFPNALDDKVKKDWETFRELHNASLDPFDDDDWSQWIHPTN